MKTYPFSITKHGHDIELYHNRLFNTMCDMESGEIPYDAKRYEAIQDMYYGPLMELMEAVHSSYTPIAQLTGEQIGLAKRIVTWASETRAASCIQRGRLDLLQYC